MDIGNEKIACGPICFALQYRDIDGGAPHGQGAGGGIVEGVHGVIS